MHAHVCNFRLSMWVLSARDRAPKTTSSQRALGLLGAPGQQLKAAGVMILACQTSWLLSSDEGLDAFLEALRQWARRWAYRAARV